MRIIQQEQYKKSNLNNSSVQFEDCSSDFIILDDKSYFVDLSEIVDNISLYGYKVKVIDGGQAVNKILNNIDFQYDTIVLAGDGGKNIFRQLDKKNFVNKEIIPLVWHRVWDKDISLGFETDIDNFSFNGKKILIIEDVIASGNTLYTMKENVERMGGTVVGIVAALIQQCSPVAKNCFVKTLSAVRILDLADSKDPFWYPAIYSVRHLLFGDDEMPDFFKLLNEKYFGDDKIEKLIKKKRTFLS